MHCQALFEAKTKDELVAAYMPHYRVSRTQEWSSISGIWIWTHLCKALIHVSEDGRYKGVIGFANLKAEEDFGGDSAASAYGLRPREGD